MLMYFCDEMAKIGDKHFFRALSKLGIMASVLKSPSKYFKDFGVTAREHGHVELAETIAKSSRYIHVICSKAVIRRHVFLFPMKCSLGS